MNLFELVAKLALDSTEYESGLQVAQNTINKFKKTAVVAFGAASAAFVAFAKGAVSTGAEFDSAMSQVAATMGVSVEQIANLRDFAKEMGATTKFTATEAAQALNYMALAGYDAEKSMSMLPTVLNLASAGGFDLARASDMVTDAQSALGLTTEQTTTMVDQMAKTASKSNTSVEQLGDAMLTIGGTAKFMAGGTDRLQTVLGLLADNGIKGSEAGTHLRNMLLKLSSPTKDGAAALENLGVKVFDAEGNMRDMQDIMLDLGGAMDSLTQEQRVQAISDIFNARDLSAVNALLGTSKERWEELGGVIAEASGSAQQMAGTQLDNLTGDITVMKSALDGIKIQFSEGITPAIRDVVKRITTVLSKPKTQKFLKEVGEKLGNVIKIITEKAMVVIPRLVSFIGDVARSIKDNIVLIGGLVVAIKAIRSPVSAAVTAVGLLVGAFGLMKLTAQDVDVELENLSDSEKELVKNARDAAGAFDESMETYSQAVAGIDSEMTNVQSAWQTLQGYVDENGKIAEGHEQEVSELLSVINEALGTQYALNGDMIEQYQEMSAEVDKLIEKQWAQKLLDARSESYNLAKSQLEDAQKRLGIAKVELDTKQKTYEEIRNNKAALEETMRTQRDVLDALGNELDLLDQGTDAYEDKAAELNAANIAYNESVDAMKRLEEAEKDAQFALGMQASAWREASEDVDKLVGEIGRYDEAYSAFLEGNYTDAKEILESDIAYRWKHLEKGQKVDKAQLEQMKRDYAILYAAYEDYWAKLEAGQEGYNKEELHRLREQMLDLNVIIQDQLAIAEENGEQFGKNVGSGIISGLDRMKTGVKNKAGDVVRVMFSEMNKVAQIKSPSRRGRAIGKNIGGSVGLGLDDSYDGVIKTADDFTEGLFGALDKDAGNTSFVTAGSGNGFGEILGVLRDIRDNIGNDIVMQDGTIVGWMDKQLGRIAAQKARGTA